MERSPSHSWWWDSHQSPKHSQWLQSNMEELDEKVKSLLKLVEADADSFAQRAEMYYQRRPELINLVEEFYRAYRSLAERYDVLRGEIKQNIPKALQVQYGLSCDSPRGYFFGRSHCRRERQGLERSLKRSGMVQKDELELSEDSDIWESSSDEKKENRFLQDSPSSSSDFEVDNSTEGEKLQQALLKLGHENKQLTCEYQSGVEENKKLQITVKELHEDITRLQEENIRIVEKWQTGLEESATLEDRVKTVEEDLSGLEEENARLSAELSTSGLHLKEVKGELSVLQEDKQILREDTSESLEQRNQLEREVEKLQVEGTKLEDSDILDSSSDEKKESKSLQDSLSSSSDVGVDNSTEVEKLEQALLELGHGNKQLTCHCQRGVEESNKLQITVKELQEEITRLLEEKLRLVEKWQTGLEESTALEDRVKTVEEDLSGLEEENARLSAEISARDLHLKEVKGELSVLQEEKKILIEGMCESVEQKNQLEREVERLQLEGTKLTAAALDTLEWMRTLEERIKEPEEENKKLTVDISAAVEQSDIAMAALRFMKGEFSSLIKRNKELRDEIRILKDKDEQRLILEEESMKLRNEQLELRRKEEEGVNELNMKIKELHGRVTFLDAENQKQQLVLHDRAEEKREAIRQLCFSINVVQEKNLKLEEALYSARMQLHNFCNASSNQLPTWRKVLFC